MSQSVIVFWEDCILAASGREGRYPALSQVKRVSLQGQGDSFGRWGQALAGLPEEWKTGPVWLVLPAGLCSSRVMKLPYAKGRQLAAMASKEAADGFRNEAADFSLIYSDMKSGVDLCAGGADEGQLKRFLELCEEAGISVGGITVPMEGYLRLLGQLEGYRNTTAIYLFFEEGSMTSILCQDGRYLYSGRSRLFSEPVTLDFGTEIVRSISGILQFYSGEKRENPITWVYYAGCAPEDFEAGLEGIRALNLEAAPMALDRRIAMPQGETASDWAACVGAFVCAGKKEKRIDLYRTIKEKAEREQGEQKVWPHLILPGAVLAGCLAVTGVVVAMNIAAARDVRSKQEWIEDPAIQARYQEALLLQQRLGEIEGGIAAVERTDQNLSVYPELSSDVLRRIESVGGSGIGCFITGYEASSGVLTFEASSREVIDVPVYILALEESGLFHAVDYSGYDFEDEWYTLSVSCTLEGRVSKEAQEQGRTLETVGGDTSHEKSSSGTEGTAGAMEAGTEGTAGAMEAGTEGMTGAMEAGMEGTISAMEDALDEKGDV